MVVRAITYSQYMPSCSRTLLLVKQLWWTRKIRWDNFILVSMYQNRIALLSTTGEDYGNNNILWRCYLCKWNASVYVSNTRNLVPLLFRLRFSAADRQILNGHRTIYRWIIVFIEPYPRCTYNRSSPIAAAFVCIRVISVHTIILSSLAEVEACGFTFLFLMTHPRRGRTGHARLSSRYNRHTLLRWLRQSADTSSPWNTRTTAVLQTPSVRPRSPSHVRANRAPQGPARPLCLEPAILCTRGTRTRHYVVTFAGVTTEHRIGYYAFTFWFN